MYLIIDLPKEAFDSPRSRQFVFKHAPENYLYGTPEPVAIQPSFLRQVFSELNRSRDVSRLNPALEPTSQRAFNEAKKWILWVTNKFNLVNPFIVIPGDGGIIVEWYNGNDFISVNFDKEDSDFDSVLYKLNGRKDSVDFNEETLADLINTLISKDCIESPQQLLAAAAGAIGS